MEGFMVVMDANKEVSDRAPCAFRIDFKDDTIELNKRVAIPVYATGHFEIAFFEGDIDSKEAHECFRFNWRTPLCYGEVWTMEPRQC